jgi:diacylglycerol kinase (ATP)
MDIERGFVLVFNPMSGGRSFEVLRRLTSRLDGRVAPVVKTTRDESFAPALRDALREVRLQTNSHPIVVAVGGDGTLSIALNAIGEPDDVPLAVVPAGSGNDFAAAIGCGTIDAAIDAVERGVVRRFDLGIVNGRRFANCVGMGLDAEVGAIAARLRGRGYPARASYFAGALAGLFAVKPVGIELRANGRDERFESGVLATVGNGPTYGGGFRGAPNARLDDGVFDVYVFSDVEGFLRRYRLMRRIQAGKHEGDPNVRFFRGGEFSLQFDREVAMHVDGELSTVSRADFRLIPGGMSIVTPAGGEARAYGVAGDVPARI